MKTLNILIFLLIAQYLSGQHFTKKEINDTISKYGVFEGYKKLKGVTKNGIYYQKTVPYDSIKNDIAIKEKFLKLLEKEELKKHLLFIEKEQFNKVLQQGNFDTISFIKQYTNITRNTSNKRLLIKIDSIKKNKNIYQKYLDSAFAEKYKRDERYVIQQLMKNEEYTIIDFLYKTNWEEVKNYTKQNCTDVTNINSYCSRFLIELNDFDTVKRFNNYFITKLNSGTLDYEDYLFIKKIKQNKEFLSRIYLAILISKKEYELNTIEGELFPLQDRKKIKCYFQTLKGSSVDDIISIFDLLKKDFFNNNNTPNYKKIISFLKENYDLK